MRSKKVLKLMYSMKTDVSWSNYSSIFFFVNLSKLMEKEMVTHSSIFAWRIPWTEEPGRLQPMRSQRVRYN